MLFPKRRYIMLVGFDEDALRVIAYDAWVWLFSMLSNLLVTFVTSCLFV